MITIRKILCWLTNKLDTKKYKRVTFSIPNMREICDINHFADSNVEDEVPTIGVFPVFIHVGEQRMVFDIENKQATIEDIAKILEKHGFKWEVESIREAA